MQHWDLRTAIWSNLNLTTAKQGALNGTLMTILGAAATPAMFLAHILIRKMGKRNLVIFYLAFNTLCMAGMYLFIENIWVLFAFVWLKGFFAAFPLITDGAINADILDYQQYKTGDRLEGLMGQFVGIIGTFISMGVTYFLQTIVMQNHFGLVDNYDDLYQSAFREPLSKGVIIIGIAGYLLSLIPFVTMYTLTEEKHDAYITILKIRAALEDYATDALSDGELEAAKTSYAEAIEEYKQLSSADKLSKKRTASAEGSHADCR